ncbi:MAG: S41 family peptidase [Acidobacteria bacterium]|nr:S41 family peptidase [Acidobacteriota bacterium]
MLTMKWIIAATLTVLVVLSLSGSSVHEQSLDGVWRSEGYGMLFDIHGTTLKSFEVTTTTCVPGDAAQREDTGIDGREATFKTTDEDLFFIRSGGTADHRLLHNVSSVSDVRIDRIAKLPATCEHPTPNTPQGNFEVFTRTWAENYILFDQQKADWDATVAANRPKITGKTTPTELYDVLAGMIEPFHNLHTYIDAPDLKREFHTYRPGTDRVVKGDRHEFRTKIMPSLLAITDRAYLQTPIRKWCNDQVQYAHVNEAVGYLRILSFSGYSKERGFANGLIALETALDEIFSDPKLKALVIDVRINFGGDDGYGLEIASRLATADYLAYTKVARADPVDRNKWTAEDPSMVHPSSRPSFHGPVVELVGPLTISAGETFTQALMGHSPHIVRIGENTQGVFSDILGRRLPNRWRFGLPNEIYRTADGTIFDLVGIPPDIEVRVFADADVSAGKDPAMARALEILRQPMSSQ